MKTHALLLLFMLTAAAERNLEKRIYGGHNCDPFERQYHVRIWVIQVIQVMPQITQRYTGCGGSLINHRWVLTAGHCGNGGPLRLTLGAHGFPPLPPQDQEIPANQQFVYYDGHHCHDIMLLRLNTDVPNLPIIHLPPNGCGRPTGDIGVAGFGPTGAVLVPNTNPVRYEADRNTHDPADLRCGTMTITPCPTLNHGTITAANSFCYHHLPPVNAAGPPAGPNGGVDTCGGDSGGAVEQHDLMGAPRIYGVHIHGGPFLCVSPAKATDVCNHVYREWIHTVLTDAHYDPLPNVPVGDPDY